MKTLTIFLLGLTLTFAGLAAPAFAEETHAAPLLINLTSDDPHSANMAITFGKRQMERGHPLTIFLNDRAVAVADRGNGERFGDHQATLADLIKQGATVLICPMCMQHFGVKREDLMDDVQVSNPELTGAALFKPGTQTLSW